MDTTLHSSTGVPGLDDVLGGGFPSGNLFLVQGEPGSGKTTLGLQFLIAGVACGDKTMYITLSESRRELEGVAQSHNWSLSGIHLFEFTPTEESLKPEDQYSAFHPSDVEFQDTTLSILKQVEELKPTRVVFDSLSELRLLAHDSLRYRRQILALKHFFSNRNCTVILLDDGTAEGHDRQLQSIAHGVILLSRLERDYGIERRRLRVSKLRGARFREGFHDYTIQTGGLAVYPRLIAAEHRQPEPEGRVESGLAALDTLWGGGVSRGTSTLILGPAGTGKSSLAMAYLVSAALRGEFGCAFLFDETKSSAIRRAAHLGLDPSPFIESGLISMQQVDPAEISPGEFGHRVRVAVEEQKARILVIDTSTAT
ncbi:MAG: ATPase domain-containing protein [Bryobacteraceae bacterium]